MAGVRTALCVAMRAVSTVSAAASTVIAPSRVHGIAMTGTP